MPLSTGKSKAAFSKNVATEINAGKPQKQAMAIAYAEKGEKKHTPCKRCAMSKGGMCLAHKYDGKL